MCFILKMDNSMIYFTHINTVAGMLLWFYHILDKNYPIKPISLLAFTFKLLSDILDKLVYYDPRKITVAFLSVFLPCFDAIFIIVYIYRYYNKERYDAFYDKFEKYLPKTVIYVPEKTKRAYKKQNKKKKRKK